MNFFVLTVASLATFRLAHMLSDESGPGRIFLKVRRSASARSATKEGLSCPLCTSVWFSAITTTSLWVLDYFPAREWLLYWMAVSGGAILFNAYFNRK